MSDQKIGIEISTTGGEQAVGVLNKIGAATAETAKADVAAQAAIVDATDKAFTSKTQLKEIVDQLGKDFPLLGTIGGAALSPIAFASTGIASAFALWNAKLKEVEST